MSLRCGLGTSKVHRKDANKEKLTKTYFKLICSPIKTYSDSFGSHHPSKYENRFEHGPA